MAEPPLISCLMVARPVPERLRRLRQSLDCYLRQTYARRELVIVIDGRPSEPTTTAEVKALVRGLGRSDVRVVEPANARSLGALRNVSLDHARGDLVCVWDDDDLHHPRRLAAQQAAMQATGAEALCLQHFTQFFEAERQLFCTNFLNTVVGGLPTTLMYRRAAGVRYPEAGPRADREEDMALIEQLAARGDLRMLAGHPHLYVYVCHGANTCGVEHHRAMRQLFAMSPGLIRRREAELRAGLAAFDFGPGPVTVEGRDGRAFVLHGEVDAAALDGASGAVPLD